MRKQYTIGVDFGTLSARAVLADLETGKILADSVSVYANAVLDRQLPETGEALPAGWALEDPADWEEALYATISGVIRKSGVEPEKMGDIMDQLLKVNNLALEGKPDDLTVATHICRGNYNSSWASQGGYEPVAERLFAHENVDAYYLEFDDARSGGFEPLRFVTPGKKVVLGLITSKRPELEDNDAVIARIHEAAKYVPLENLCLSPQCGFASCEIGNKLTEEQQWEKLRLVKRIAEKVWGENA